MKRAQRIWLSWTVNLFAVLNHGNQALYESASGFKMMYERNDIDRA